MWLLLSFFLEGCLCCRWCCYRVSLDRTRVSFYLNWEWGRHWSCILLFLFTQKELTQFPGWWRRMQARCIWNVHLAISVCWTVWYSDQNHNSNSNKTFLMPAKFRLHIFYCNVTMYQYVEKSVGLTLLLMVQFCEILSNEPSTYINWFDSVRGWCLKIEKSVCLFIHSINMISVDRGLTPCRMFFHNHHQEKIRQEAISLIKIHVIPQANGESKMIFFTPVWSAQVTFTVLLVFVG